MKRMIPGWILLALILFLPTIALAQNAQVKGQVFDRDGKPWPGVTVVLKSDTGRSFTLTTDKDGKFSQIGMSAGVYTFTLTQQAVGLNYSEKHQVQADQETDVTINFKQLIAQQGPSPEQQKQQEQQQTQFKNMKAHVDAGLAAIADSDELRKQLRAAPADQKAAIQDKLNTDYQTAVTELQQAEQSVGVKDTKNHAVVWSNLGVAYNLAGRFDDSVNAYQKAIDLNPQAGYYVGLSGSLANAAGEEKDPAAATSKINDAGADCDKATALDPTTTARCWKNIGIVLNNKGMFKDAIPALQKATTADAKDAQTWFLLGSAYTGMIDSKQEGDKVTFIIPPGTADAYQKCIDTDPNGPYAPQCKTMLDQLAAMGGGESTVVGSKKPAKKK